MKCFRLFLAIVAFQIPVFAAEVLMYDSTFTVTESYHGFFYFKPKPSAGTNWISPNNYYQGTWCNRFEVIDGPFKQTGLQFSTCIWQDVVGNWQSWKETCGFPQCGAPTPGIYFQYTKPADWWKMAEPVDFARVSDFRDCGLVLWCNGMNMSDWVPANESCWDQRSSYLPLKMRLTIVLVSSGSTFSGWNNYINTSVTDPQHPVSESAPLMHSSIKVMAHRTIAVTTPGNTPFSLTIMGVDGRIVKTVTGNSPSVYCFPRSEIKPGIYFLKLESGQVKEVRTMIME